MTGSNLLRILGKYCVNPDIMITTLGMSASDGLEKMLDCSSKYDESYIVNSVLKLLSTNLIEGNCKDIRKRICEIMHDINDISYNDDLMVLYHYFWTYATKNFPTEVCHICEVYEHELSTPMFISLDDGHDGLCDLQFVKSRAKNYQFADPEDVTIILVKHGRMVPVLNFDAYRPKEPVLHDIAYYSFSEMTGYHLKRVV
jgi:hypothetical protein